MNIQKRTREQIVAKVAQDIPTGSFVGGVSKSMLKKSRLNFDKIEKCK